jgi:ubiquinone/menaquinone biosynthesis C-methylase UbiE
MKAEDLKTIVREKYGQIARQSLLDQETSCCGPSGCCDGISFSMIGDDYQGLEGHFEGADLGLGCGLPTQYAGINVGDRVLDLGSGAGNDCFIARSIVGETGWVTGLDFTEEMIAKAMENNQKLGYTNVDFVQGDIENMPLPDNSFDVIVSNCVLNLVPDKQKAFAEILRVLQPGGHFCVSDVVIKGQLPPELRKDAELYAGCVSGALEMDVYLAIVTNQGFDNVTIHKEKQINIPNEVLQAYLSTDAIKAFKQAETGIFSITVSAYKTL